MLNIIIEMMQRFKDSPTSNVKYEEVLRIYAIRICLILGLLMNAKNKKCITTHLTKGIVVRSRFHADLGSSHYSNDTISTSDFSQP